MERRALHWSVQQRMRAAGGAVSAGGGSSGRSELLLLFCARGLGHPWPHHDLERVARMEHAHTGKPGDMRSASFTQQSSSQLGGEGEYQVPVMRILPLTAFALRKNVSHPCPSR